MKFARRLRKQMTAAEKAFWYLVRDRRLAGHKFRRQFPIEPYVLDFICYEARLAVEIDGGQHAESEKDKERTAWLQDRGWRVIRFWNNEILQNTDGVKYTIMEHLNSLSPSPARQMPSDLSRRER